MDNKENVPRVLSGREVALASAVPFTVQAARKETFPTPLPPLKRHAQLRKARWSLRHDGPDAGPENEGPRLDRGRGTSQCAGGLGGASTRSGFPRHS